MIRFLVVALLVCFSACQKNQATFRQTVRLSLTSDPVSLDPRKARDLNSIALVRMLFEGLTRTSKMGQTELALASSVEVLNDGFQYVFHLHPSKWSNGDPLTADDFVRSWKTILDPLFPSDIAYQLYPIKNGKKAKMGEVGLDEVGVFAKDHQTLVVDLEQPLPYFLELVSMTSFFCTHSKSDNEKFNFISNGPFQLSSWKHSDQLSFVRNPYYWQAEEIRLEEIDFVITSADTAFRMFEEKKLDWVGAPLSSLPSDAVPHLKKTNQLEASPFLATYFFRVNTDPTIGGKENSLSDPELRRALSSVLGRDSIVENILQGGERSAKNLVPPEMGLCLNVDDLPAGSFQRKDPITISYMNNEINAAIVQAVQKQWSDAFGLEIRLEAIEPKVFFQRVSQRDFQIAAGRWIADFNDPINFLEVFKFRNVGTNNTGWENLEYIDLLDRSALCSSKEERNALLAQAEEILVREMPIIPLFHYVLNYLKQKELKGVVLSPTGQLDLRWAYLEEKR